MDEADSFDETEFADDQFRAFLGMPRDNRAAPPTPEPAVVRCTFDLKDFGRVKVFSGGVSGEERLKGWAFTFKVVVGSRSAEVRRVLDLWEHADLEKSTNEIAARDEDYA